MKKPGLSMQIEELQRAIEAYPLLEGRTGKSVRKAEVDFRIQTLTWAKRSLEYLQTNEDDIRIFAQISKLNPGAMQTFLAWVRREQARIAEEKKDAA